MWALYDMHLNKLLNSIVPILFSHTLYVHYRERPWSSNMQLIVPKKKFFLENGNRPTGLSDATHLKGMFPFVLFRDQNSEAQPRNLVSQRSMQWDLHQVVK